MLVGETQNTCYEVAKDFAAIIKGKDPLAIETRMQELHDYIAFNTTIKALSISPSTTWQQKMQRFLSINF